MNQNINNISKRIEVLDIEIQKLEKRLAEKNWERKKYMQFSDIDIKNSNKT
tara:strand:- start:390 stop:542 length:153 start_codon:yes stop_codon:yes gene_type:complete